jgi:RNA-directed DNA polymerase
MIHRGQVKQMSKLKLIAEKAQDKKLRFTSLAHHMNVELLGQCYKMLRKSAASGIDGVTVEAYGENLQANLESLVERLKSKKYRPKAVRRAYIPKPGKAELRPLGIPSVEDKLVQMALKILLEPVFEPLFKESSHGFRPRRSCHTAIKQLNSAVMFKSTNYVVEVDVAKFFDTVQHARMLECLKQRVSDPSIHWLVSKLLKAGVMINSTWEASEQGTPQGGIISPLLANIYLHYVLDLWFELRFKKQAKGYVELIRYCDDFVMACESEEDANLFLKELEERLAESGLRISQEKTKIIRFGRRAWNKACKENSKVATFDFLGFTHYCGASRRGKFVMGHKTTKNNLRRKLKSVNEWLSSIRSVVPLKEWWPILKAKLIGHYNYFGINGNMRWLSRYYCGIKALVFKWINRRSQKKSMTWEQFNRYLQWNPLPTPSIMHPILYSYAQK